MENADGVVICTEWDEFLSVDYEKGFEVMNKPAYVFDGRMIVDKESLEDMGYIVETIGF